MWLFLRSENVPPAVLYVMIPAFLLDCLFGDPQNRLHPIRLIGNGITAGTRLFQRSRIKSPVCDFVSGMILTLAVVAAVFAITWFCVQACHGLAPWFGGVLEVILCYFIISPRALRDESMKVFRAVENDDLPDARMCLSRIVGRDTQNLEYPGIIRATVETVSENFSDGVIAPLFFVLIGGVPFGMAYKAINTLDSMIGYRNEKYEYFGKFAARLDDAANLIPARLAAMLLILAAAVTGKNAKKAMRIYVRDRYKHKSPNAAHTEAVCAGALGLQLGGDNYYHGKLVQKPTIGDDLVPPCSRHIIAVNRLMYAATVIGLVLATLCALGWRSFHA